MCQMQTTFHACGLLASGTTLLCHSCKSTKGFRCDGYTSFTRSVNYPCPNCQAGKPHPDFQDLHAKVNGGGNGYVTESPVAGMKAANPIGAKMLKGLPRAASRVSARGGIQKPTTARSGRRVGSVARMVPMSGSRSPSIGSEKAVSPQESVAETVESPRCSPSEMLDQATSPESSDSAELPLWDLLNFDAMDEVDFPLDPALRGL